MTKQSWRICIQSYARHHPNFSKESGRKFNYEIARKVQYRAIKTACHELSHVLSIRHCQGYECLMNGSSQLEEADNKPFALCPVCLRKMSSYLGFNGDELQMYRELRDVFRLMNHKDKQKNFGREIELFDKVIRRLELLYQNPNASQLDLVADNEGGNFELKNAAKPYNFKEIVQVPSEGEEGSSDITTKPVSEIRIASSRKISIRKLRQQNQNGNCISRLCRALANCFNCFQPQEEDDPRNFNQSVKKNDRKMMALETEDKHDLEVGINKKSDAK